MALDEQQLKEILSELFGLLESLETSNIAAFRALAEKKIVTEDEIERLLHEAGDASSVKWRAARVRMEYLLTPIEKNKEEAGKLEAKAEEVTKKAEAQTTQAEDQPAKDDNDVFVAKSGEAPGNVEKEPGETPKKVATAEQKADRAQSSEEGGAKNVNKDEKPETKNDDTEVSESKPTAANTAAGSSRS